MTDILDLARTATDLRKVGREHVGRCPFHDDSTPSLTVNADKGVWHCFGCNEGGGVKRLAELLGVSTRVALPARQPHRQPVVWQNGRYMPEQEAAAEYEPAPEWYHRQVLATLKDWLASPEMAEAKQEWRRQVGRTSWDDDLALLTAGPDWDALELQSAPPLALLRLDNEAEAQAY